MKNATIYELKDFQELSYNEQLEASGGILAIAAAVVGITSAALGITYYIGYGVGYYMNH